MSLTRRSFMQKTAAGTASLALPTLLTPRRTAPRTAAGTLAFEPVYVQRGAGPHLRWAYASDTKWDAFHSDIVAEENDRVVISDAEGQAKFGINTRWNVEGFGFIFITADNGGDFYELPPAGETRTLNLNVELAKSRVARNRRRLERHQSGGWTPSRDLRAYVDLSESYYEHASSAPGREQQGELAQKALYYAMWASEMMELERARHAIASRSARSAFFVGCDARAFYHMDPDVFMEHFVDVFDYATITYYLRTGTVGMPDFEPDRGDRRFDTRDALLGRLEEHDVTVEGRPLFWPYPSVSPDWLYDLSYDQLLQYVEEHTREVVGHYGDRMYAWEIVNEFHDWANEVDVTPEQTIEITKLMCDVAKDTAPNVHRLINNCCPFAEYVQLGTHQERPANYPQRTPWEFMKDLDDAGVDFTISGTQMYFPHRDLQDTIMLVERFESFGRPIQMTEVGTSAGPTRASVLDGSLGMPEEPYVWHGHWDEKLQSDWMEGLYTLGYANPHVEAVNWYDFLDGQAWINNGGMLGRDETPKPVYHRLKRLREEWDL